MQFKIINSQVRVRDYGSLEEGNVASGLGGAERSKRLEKECG